jgi:membrane associated rhomboid family serine protease
MADFQSLEISGTVIATKQKRGGICVWTQHMLQEFQHLFNHYMTQTNTCYFFTAFMMFIHAVMYVVGEYEDLTDYTLHGDDTTFYSYITYMFVHHDWVPLIANMCFLGAMGSTIERCVHFTYLFPIYVAGGLASGLCWKWLHTSGELWGPHGALYSLVGTFITNTALNFETLAYPRVTIVIVALIILAQIAEAIWQMYDTPIDTQWSGFLFGLGPAVLFLPNYTYQHYESVMAVFGLLVLLIYFLVLPILVGLDLHP